MNKEPIMRELAIRLRVERARLQWTLDEAHARSGVHAVTISKYENAKKLPTMEALYKLAEAYGVEAASLVPPNALAFIRSGRVKKKDGPV